MIETGTNFGSGDGRASQNTLVMRVLYSSIDESIKKIQENMHQSNVKESGVGGVYLT